MTDTTPWIAAEADGVRKHAPATLRNRMAIADVLRDVLPLAGTVLEVASGSGEHAAYLAGEIGGARLAAERSRSRRTRFDRGVVRGHRQRAAAACAGRCRGGLARGAGGCAAVRQHGPYQSVGRDARVARRARRLLAIAAPLVLYGPYRQAGVPLAAGNAAFDQSLRSRDPAWGLRGVEDVAAAATGLALDRIVPISADNLRLVFRRG